MFVIMDRRTGTAAVVPDANLSGSSSLAVYVVATTAEGTESALTAAGRLANGLDMQITVLVPHVVPYPLPLDGATGESSVLARRYGAIASAIGLDATGRLCLCRSPREVFRSLLSERAIVVVGGRRHRFWPTSAERLARRLQKLGHHVVFAPMGERATRPGEETTRCRRTGQLAAARRQPWTW